MKRRCPECHELFLDKEQEGKGVVVGIECPICGRPINVLVDKKI